MRAPLVEEEGRDAGGIGERPVSRVRRWIDAGVEGEGEETATAR